MEPIRSPLNYTGNKYRILPQIERWFPEHIGVMVDLFCGGATVGLNTSCGRVIFADSNERVIDLLRYLSACEYAALERRLGELTVEFGLSYSARNGFSRYKNNVPDGNPNNGLKEYNKAGYYAMRDAYNALSDKQSPHACELLYLLMVYGFNNDLRFSKEGKFNLPAGKTDLNASNLKKVESYIGRTHAIEAEFLCGDFRSKEVRERIFRADFVYMDPPYLITDAVYNEGGGWTERDERALLELFDELLAAHIPFVASNVLEKKNARNVPLFEWCAAREDRVEVHDIDYHYRSASYNKLMRDGGEREIVVVSKRNA